MGYDIIGDVHGYSGRLKHLLKKLGYQERKGVFRHPYRKAIFVGDLIDRGPGQLATLEIVRRMQEAGSGQTVMGNHELNAIRWMTPDPNRPGDYLRRRYGSEGRRNHAQHAAFLGEVSADPVAHQDWVEWFASLPLWLDLAGFRVVHACWHIPSIDVLRPILSSEGRIPKSERLVLLDSKTPQGKAVDILLRGPRIALPEGHHIVDAQGVKRRRIRVGWWNPSHIRYREAVFDTDSASRQALPDTLIPENRHCIYQDEKPVFFGHYWFKGNPGPLTPHLACLDYSVARGGNLVAYRWNGESNLSETHFVVA